MLRGRPDINAMHGYPLLRATQSPNSRAVMSTLLTCGVDVPLAIRSARQDPNYDEDRVLAALRDATESLRPTRQRRSVPALPKAEPDTTAAGPSCSPPDAVAGTRKTQGAEGVPDLIQIDEGFFVIPETEADQLIAAIKTSDVDRVRELLASKTIDVNAEGGLPLLYATQSPIADRLVAMVIERGADVQLAQKTAQRHHDFDVSNVSSVISNAAASLRPSHRHSKVTRAHF